MNDPPRLTSGRKDREDKHIHDLCEQDHCGCEDEEGGIVRSAFVHTIKIAVFIFIISLRLLYVVSRDVYKHHTYTRHEKNYPFKRLDILDRNGNILAKNIVIYDLYLQPSKITNYNETIDKINKVLPNTIKDKKTLIEKLDQRKDTYKTIFIKKGLTFQQQQELLGEDIEGLVFEEQEKRFSHYPEMDICDTMRNHWIDYYT